MLEKGERGIEKKRIEKVQASNKIDLLFPIISLSFLQIDKELGHTF
jgi:hypothetical protein